MQGYLPNECFQVNFFSGSSWTVTVKKMENIENDRSGNENRTERVDDIGLLIDCANINGSGTFLCQLNEILSIWYPLW